MPVRSGSIRQGSERAITAKEKKEELMTLANNYLGVQARTKALTTEKDKINKSIKEIMEDSKVYELNGKHKEAVVPAGNGKDNILVQLQVAESISTVDNIIGLMREKLGDKAETYITTVEVLHPKAIDNMYKSGLITDKDILDWTNTKETERLIVKLQEDKK